MSRIIELYRQFRQQGVRPSSNDPLQRPSLYIPGLTAKPWHETEQLEWVRRLEQAAPEIRAELLRLDETRAEFVPYVDGIGPTPGGAAWGTRYIHDQGTWDTFYLEALGQPFARNQRLCPKTTEALHRVPRRTTSAMFSRLGPRTHIPAHCGPSNTVLRAHLGLAVPEGCEMRVGKETRSWQEERCLLFDDSFEHEVWNRSEESRVVLMFYVYHPDLTVTEIDHLEEIRKELRVDEQTGFQQLVDAMLAGKPILPKSP